MADLNRFVGDEDVEFIDLDRLDEPLPSPVIHTRHVVPVKRIRWFLSTLLVVVILACIFVTLPQARGYASILWLAAHNGQQSRSIPPTNSVISPYLVNVMPAEKGQTLVNIPTSFELQNGVLQALHQDNGHVQWRTHLRIAYAQKLVDSVVYVQETDYRISALRVSDGHVLWRSATYGSVYEVEDGIVYVRTLSQAMEVIRASDGKKLWHSDDIVVSGDMVVKNGIAYLGSVSLGPGKLMAVRGRDGAILWSQQRPGQINVFQVDAGMVYVSQPGVVTAVKASNGQSVWQHAMSTASLPFVGTNCVYIPVEDGRLMLALRKQDGSLAWQKKLAKPGNVMDNEHGLLYFVTNNDNSFKLEAWHEQDGSLAWVQQDREGQVMIKDHIVYVSALSKGAVNAYQADTGRLLWFYQGQPGEFVEVADDGLVYVVSFPAASIKAISVRNGLTQWAWQMQK